MAFYEMTCTKTDRPQHGDLSVVFKQRRAILLPFRDSQK
jgi:hypothetical protein